MQVDGSGQGRDFQTRHDEMDLQFPQEELISMGYLGLVRYMDGQKEPVTSHPKSFLSRCWELILTVLSHLSETHKVQFPTRPASMHQNPQAYLSPGAVPASRATRACAQQQAPTHWASVPPSPAGIQFAVRYSDSVETGKQQKLL